MPAHRKYDWSKVQEKIEAGFSAKECMKTFGFHSSTFYDAVKCGRITFAKKKDNIIPIEELSLRYTGRQGRGLRFYMKQRLLKEKLVKYECALCGIYEWRGQKLILRLDHIDGNPCNFDINNLRLLCPNCDSQQDTFCHRNIGRNKAGVAESADALALKPNEETRGGS